MAFGLGWTSGSGGAAAVGGAIETWIRPFDWPDMPASVADHIEILTSVTDSDSNFCAVSATVIGGYTVDWGDGVVENVGSGVQRDHKYVYSTLATPVTSLGYKTATILIYPQAANPITSLNLGVKNATAGLAAYSNPWLDIQVNAPSCTTMTFRGGVEARWVERINLVAIGAVTSMTGLFQNCGSLQSITFPSGTPNVTSINATFQGCSSLRYITFPSGSLAGVTNAANAFNGCSSLQLIEFPAGSMSLVTTLANAFAGCGAMHSITFPSGSLVNLTTLDSAFFSCYSLQSITFPAGSLVSLTTLASAFQNCSSIVSIAFPAGSLASLTTLANAFTSCISLQYITFPAGSLTGVLTLDNAFYGCVALSTIAFPTGALASVTSTSTAFYACYNLEKIVNCSIPVSFTVSYNLSATELNAIYTSLPVVTAKTFTTSTNYGYAASTQSIATGKGWTLA